MVDAQEIAEWLFDQIQGNGRERSYQSGLVQAIREKFGEEWSYVNGNGNWAINQDILTKFRKIKGKYVHWDRSNQSWRIVTADELENIEAMVAERKGWKEEEKRLRAEYEAAHQM